MRRIVLFALALACAVPLLADAVEEVRQAELGFARAFADRDKARFFSYVSDDAIFLSAVSTARGKEAVIASWSRYFDGVAEAPFVWGPDRVSVSADGLLGVSTGPVYLPNGTHVGDYLSTWRRQSDGSWKILFDSTGPGPAPLVENAVPFEEGFVPTPDGVKLHFRKIGRGPITLIVPLDFALFDAMKQFADIATVITYDMRSRGRSTRAAEVNTLTIAQDVIDLETVRAYFKVDRFVPVGFSYLGKVVILYAAAHPQHVSRIVQLGPAGNRFAPVRTAAADFGAPAADIERWQKMRAEGAAEKAPREFCIAQWQVLRYFMVGNPKKAMPMAKVEEMCSLENEWPRNSDVALHGVMSSLEKATLTPEAMKKVTMPVLTIHGTQDRNAPYNGGRTWAQELPDARLVTVEGAAHALWQDDPVTTFSAIRYFLRGEWPLGATRIEN
jgi:pimeloyl-ACP methyl ester carboxylesterase/ketosteroid isomerase-like protein